MINRDELINYCNEFLMISNYQDYSPNGLQVQGNDMIKTIITGVTACQQLINEAISKNADLLLVHHGYFWKNEPEIIVGMKYNRIKALVNSNINLAAYHLPLDGHPSLGNNFCLGELLEIETKSILSVDNNPGMVYVGELKTATSAENFKQLINEKLARQTFMEASSDKEIKKVAWCTGGAQDFIFNAIESGADAFITGEVSERTVHIARENNIAFYAAGHHATERAGIKALGEHIASKFNIEHEFIDVPNDV